jgi:diguanylate cyclase (GGDEF)-like protein
MPQDQVLLTILGVGGLATLVLVATIALLARSRRRSRLAGGGDLRTDDDAREAAAIEAFVASVSPDAGVRVRPLVRPSAAVSTTGEAITRGVPVMPLGWPGATDPPEADDREPAAVAVSAPRARPPESTPVQLADAATWARTVREESARTARFRHPVTVVMAELPHLDVLADRLGREVADQIVRMTAHVLVTEGRAVDRVARLGDARFGVLMLETEETGAGTYVERVRAAADDWLASAGLSIRLSLGWASPEGGDVIAAAAVARQRMYEASRR